MIRRRKSQIIIFFTLQACAVAIICFGSLINFHQYKIWGKPLIPNIVGYKRDVEKYARTFAVDKSSGAHQFHPSGYPGWDFVGTSLVSFSGNDPCTFLITGMHPVCFTAEILTSVGLRGPPSA